jgi:phytoene dehydrogenase-like protein
VALLERSVDATASALGRDARAYRDLFTPLVQHSETLVETVFAPLLPPKHPIALAHFGLTAIRSARGVARSRFRGEHARALFGGLATHSVRPLTATASASFALVFGLVGHVWGWPLPRGGSQSIADALAAHLTSLGGSIMTGRRVTNDGEFADADVVMLDVNPRQVVTIAGDRLARRYRRRLLRFRHGPALFKLDWALSAPIPWRATECRRAATLHLGGTLDEITRAEEDVAHGRHPERPFVLLAQQSLFDPTRAPADKHTAWAYCHVPNGSTVDMTARIEAQVERFAPGFRDVVLARCVTTPADLERRNANCVGGDVVGGANDVVQMLARPILALDPYAIPVRDVGRSGRTRPRPRWFLCSASTPPGGGVHGMSGFHAAWSALRALGVDVA